MSLFQYSKDGVTVSTIIDTGHVRKDGLYPVRVRVTYRRIRQYYSTGKAMTPEDWDALPTTKARALLAVRKDIESSYNIVRDAVEELAMVGDFSFDALNTRLKGAATDTVNTAFRAKIAALRYEGRIGKTITLSLKVSNALPVVAYRSTAYRRHG